MDADLQDPPELLPEMLRMAKANDATVMAGRLGAYQNPFRMLTSKIFKRLLGALCGIPANVGTYFVVSADTVERMLRPAPKHPQVVVLAGRYSAAILTLPYRRQARAIGGSAYSTLGRVSSAVRALRCAWECRTRRHDDDRCVHVIDAHPPR
jgi:dolichol-phosphate mannosyltransferase